MNIARTKVITAKLVLSQQFLRFLSEIVLVLIPPCAAMLYFTVGLGGGGADGAGESGKVPGFLSFLWVSTRES